MKTRYHMIPRYTYTRCGSEEKCPTTHRLSQNHECDLWLIWGECAMPLLVWCHIISIGGSFFVRLAVTYDYCTLHAFKHSYICVFFAMRQHCTQPHPIDAQVTITGARPNYPFISIINGSATASKC